MNNPADGTNSIIDTAATSFVDYMPWHHLPENFHHYLVVASFPGIFCLMLALGRWLKRKQGVQLTMAYHLFSVALAIYLPAKLFEVHFSFRRELAAVTCLLGGLFFVALVNRYVWDLHFQQKRQVKIPPFLTQVFMLAVVLITIIVIVTAGYGVNIKGLFLAPGIMVAVVGLAMQDLLGNVVSGLALQFGKSFKDGDWLLVDNKYAQVIEINWRTTRMRTIDDISIDVPNRDLSKQTITNLNKPTRRHAMRVSVNIDYSSPPTRVKSILLHAAANAKGVCPEVRPVVYLNNFGEYAVQYDIKFWLDDHGQYFEVCDAIRTNVWYGLQRHGLKIPYPIRTVQLERSAHTRQQEVQNTARLMLRQHKLFKTLNDQQLDLMLPRGDLVHFGRGEKIIQQGDEGHSMFILVNGEANVVLEKNGAPTFVASLGKGDCFGEMSLLTGEKRSATILANTDCEVVEIQKTVLAKSLKEHPALMEQLSALLAQRRMENEGILASNTATSEVQAKKQEYATGFLSRIKTFFEL